MKILVIDCSQKNRLALIADSFIDEVLPDESELKSDSVLFKIDTLLKNHNLTIKDIDCLSVCIGPGSFTGLRVGASLAKGICLADPKKLVVFTSFDAIEYNIKKQKMAYAIAGFGNHIYLKLKNVMQCVEIAKANELINAGGWTLCAAENVINMMQVNKSVVAKVDVILVSKQKYIAGEFENIDLLQPLYLQLSQAEIEREKKLGKV